MVQLRSRHKKSVVLDGFLALSQIGLAHGIAVLVHASGFLAVPAAGLALQRVKEQPGNSPRPGLLATGLQSKQADEALATHALCASHYLMQEVRGFKEQLERIAEVAIVPVVSATLWYVKFPASARFVALLRVMRPVSVWCGLPGTAASRDRRMLISWFGVRGIGSID